MTDEKTKVEKPKVEKPKVVTLVSMIKTIGARGTKSRKELAEKVFEACGKNGMSVNSKGKEITQIKVISLVNAFTRDIKNNRKGHWQQFKVEETENSFKILPQ